MKENNILIFNFEAHKPPVFKEAKGKDYVLYGTDKTWKNRYPDYLIDLYNTSSKHNTIVNGKTNYISGRGWTLDDTVTVLEDKVRLSQFIKSCGNDSLHELTKKIAKDEVLFGGFALEVIVNKDNKGLTINHIDFGKIRVGLDEDVYFYTADWSCNKPELNEDYTQMSLYPFNDEAEKGKSYLVYYKSYRPNLQEYPLPSYVSGIPYIESEAEIANFTLNNVKNGFSSGYIVNFHNGEPTVEAQAYIERKFKDKFSGSNNAGNQLFVFDDGIDNGVEIIPLSPNGQDERFLNLNKQIKESIFDAHGVDVSVFVKTEGSGFTNNADEKRVAIEALYNEYVEPKQRIYEELFNTFANILGLPTGLKIERIAPIKSELSEQTLISVLTTDEIRELAGYAPLEKAQEQNFSSEDNLAELWLALGNTGYNDEDLELVSEKFLDYNPFDFADVGHIDSQIIDILSNEPKTPLEEIAKSVGETPKEVQERINRLAKAGLLDTQKTQIKVTDEGKNEVEELITVYKYVKRPDAPSLEGSSRPFCRNMVRLSSTKSWTYEQINSTRFLGSKGAGNNAQGGDLFTTRGGWYTNPNTGTRSASCRHIWQSRTVRLKEHLKNK